jgi:cell shape-determining protein MreD
MNDLLLIETPIGIYTVVLIATGYTIGILRPYIPSGAVLAPLGVAFASGAAATAGYALLARLLGDPRFTLDFVLEAALLVGLYNTLLALPLFAAVNTLSARFPRARATAVT